MGKRKPSAQLIDGVPTDPHYNPEHLREERRFVPGKGDLVMLAYPKAGTHWVLYIVQLILKRGQPVSSYQEFQENMRYMGGEALEGWEPSLPLRLFQTHLQPRKETLSTEGKYIYVVRNPWDVAVSFFHMVTNVSAYNFQDGSFEEFVDAFLSEDVAGHGNYFDHVVSGYSIKDQPNVFFVSYEDLMEDGRGTILKLAHFLGEGYSRELHENEDLLQKLLTRSSAENMKDVMISDNSISSNPVWREVTCKDGYQGDSRKYNFIREAKIGSWKKYFSTEQLHRMEAAIRRTEEMSPVMDLWKKMRSEALGASGMEGEK